MTTHPWGTAQGVSPYPRCAITAGCEYAAGHHGDCTPVEVGKHVRTLRTRLHDSVYRFRLQTMLGRIEAEWLDDLVETSTPESFSPLLIVGWVSVRMSSGGYKTITAETWHRERMCKLNRASGTLSPRLYLEVRGSTKQCRGCGKLTPEELAQARADRRRLRDLQVKATAGWCWGGGYQTCGKDTLPGKTTCDDPKHKGSMTLACFDGDHTACDGILETKTRPHDQSTYTVPCGCWICH